MRRTYISDGGGGGERAGILQINVGLRSILIYIYSITEQTPIS